MIEYDENEEIVLKTVTTTYPDGLSVVKKYDKDGNLIEGSGKSPTVENAPGLPG